MLKLEKRPQPSKEWVYLSPILAVVITMIVGGVLFALLTDQIIIEFNRRYLPKIIIGEDPFEAIRIIFWDPLFDQNFSNYSRPQILIKAGPLILIAIGLSFGFKAGVWNIGAEGQYILGAIFGASVAPVSYTHLTLPTILLV